MTNDDVTAPLPLRRPGRAVRVATVHGLAAWLAAHADVDTPDWVRAVRHLDAHRDHTDAGARVRMVEAFARHHEVPLREDPLYVWAAVPLGNTPVHGVHVDYLLQTAKANPWTVCRPPHPHPHPHRADG